MFKKGLFLTVILLLIFSVGMCDLATDYTFTQQSGANYFVGTADKSDALEDANELRTIVNDLGALLVHSKMDGLYPKDLTTGGTIQIPEAGLKFSNAPANDDIAAYIGGEMAWQTKAELGIDPSLYYLKTEIDTLGKVETIYTKDITDSDELAAALGAYYLKTEIDTIGEVEAIWVKDITDSDELASALVAYYLKTAIDSQGEMETIWGVSLANDSELHSQNTDTDLDATFEATFVKKADTVNVLSDITSPGANIEDAVTKKHVQNTDTDLNSTFEATFVKKTDTVNVLSDITSSGANIEDAVTKKHTSGSETLTGDVSGTVGTNTVNKIKGHEVDETAIANDKILVYKTTGDKFVYETQSGGVDTSGTPEANDIARFTDADTIEGINYTELKTALALSSADLSDVDSIGMLDEEETVTGVWTFTIRYNIKRESDFTAPFINIIRYKDGDPTYNVANGDELGRFNFLGFHTEDERIGAVIKALVDGTPGEYDMPGRLEFLTTPDDSVTPARRMAIDNAGNIKMGDGAWTNYVNVSAGGAMTAEGTASIKATDLVITSQAAGDILYFNGTNWIRLAIGTAGQILTVNAGETAPEWQTP